MTDEQVKEIMVAEHNQLLDKLAVAVWALSMAAESAETPTDEQFFRDVLAKIQGVQ